MRLKTRRLGLGLGLVFGYFKVTLMLLKDTLMLLKVTLKVTLTFIKSNFYIC